MNVAVFVTLLLCSVAYAAVRGGAPERWMAGMFALSAAASRLLYSPAPTRFGTVEPYVAALDLVLLGGITVLLLRADRFWPIGMFAAHGTTVLAHVVRLIDLGIVRKAYSIATVAPAYLTLAILMVATIRHQMRVARVGADRDWS